MVTTNTMTNNMPASELRRFMGFSYAKSHSFRPASSKPIKRFVKNAGMGKGQRFVKGAHEKNQVNIETVFMRRK